MNTNEREDMTDNGEMTVYRLGAPCGLSDIEEGKIYEAKVQGFANFGTFVFLNSRIKGLVHKSNIKTRHTEGEMIFVRVLSIRSNGNIDLQEVVPTRYTLETVTKKPSNIRLSELKERVGRQVTVAHLLA